jgi:hypothetical protein
VSTTRDAVSVALVLVDLHQLLASYVDKEVKGQESESVCSGRVALCILIYTAVLPAGRNPYPHGHCVPANYVESLYYLRTQRQYVYR